jgi:hypothetical protein
MQRTYVSSRSPRSLRALEWVVAGIVVGLAIVVFARDLGGALGRLAITVAALGLMLAGLWAVQALFDRRREAFLRDAGRIGAAAGERDGLRIKVRGRVRATETLRGLIRDEPAVYRRVSFTLERVGLVHEAAVDFWLVDGEGAMVRVEVENARLLAPAFDLDAQTGEAADRLLALPLPRPIARAVAKRRARGESVALLGGEVLVRDGDEVVVIGMKTRAVDPTVTERLPRDTPMRTMLCAGRDQPLVIAPVKLG